MPLFVVVTEPQTIQGSSWLDHLALPGDGHAVEDDLLTHFIVGELGSDGPLSSSLLSLLLVALYIQSNVFLRV